MKQECNKEPMGGCLIKALWTKYKIAALATTYSSSEVTNMFLQQQTAMMLIEAPSANIARKYLPLLLGSRGGKGIDEVPIICWNEMLLFKEQKNEGI
jgi:hypothetical protein